MVFIIFGMALVGKLAYKISTFAFYGIKLGHLKLSLVVFTNLGMNRLTVLPVSSLSFFEPLLLSASKSW